MLWGLLLVFVWIGNVVALELSEFQGLQVQSSYSTLLHEKNAKADSLLPVLDGDRAFAELLRTYPKIWSFQRIDQQGTVATQLGVELVYLDGNREESYCQLDKSGNAGIWKLRIGLDFVSAASSTVHVHVQQCLEMAKAEWGYWVRRGEKVVAIPPRKILDEIKKTRIQPTIDPALQAELLNAHKEVVKSGNCPQDISAYAILLDVWDHVKSLSMDIAALNDHLNPEMNGGHWVHSCAFSREWNQRYSEDAKMICDESTLSCKYVQSEDGTTRWVLDPSTDRFVFQPLRILFLRFGGQSIREGGTMLDLKILPLSSRLFLEAYLDEKGSPVTLGLITTSSDE